MYVYLNIYLKKKKKERYYCRRNTKVFSAPIPYTLLYAFSQRTYYFSNQSNNFFLFCISDNFS